MASSIYIINLQGRREVKYKVKGTFFYDAMKITKIDLLKVGNLIKIFVEEKQIPCNHNILELNGALNNIL